MSVQALTWAKSTKAGGPSHKLVLLILADYADDQWSCFPGQRRIADEAELAERSVRRVLAELEEAGLLHREHRYRDDQRGRTSDRYYLRPDGQPAEAPEPIPAKSTAMVLPAIHDASTGQTAHVLPATVAGHEPVGEQLAEPPATPLPPAARAGASHDLAFEAFWREYPRRVGKPKARTAWERALRRADGHPEAIIAGAQRYAADPNREDQYTAHPTTWLNRDGWNDPALPERNGRGTNPYLRRLATRPAAGPVPPGTLFALPGGEPA